MKRVIQRLGFPLVYLGVAILVIAYLLPATPSNLLLLGGPGCIVIGSIIAVYTSKQRGEY